jgi:hypothetical protein
MIELVGLLLALGAVAVVLYPLLSSRKPTAGAPVVDDRLQDLYSKRNTAYSMLKELEFDYNSGILSEGDYRELEATYKRNAISILKSIDLHKSGRKNKNASSVFEGSNRRNITGGDLKSDIEEQVRKLRHRKDSNLDDEIERRVLTLRSTRTSANLDAEVERQISLLRNKGDSATKNAITVNRTRQLPDNGPFCPQCGEKVQDNDRFCRHCGTKLE